MFIADFHIHSKYSRATSRECIPEILDLWARRKGLEVIGTGDFTHPAWRKELKEKLIPAEEGLYTLKDDFRRDDQIPGQSSKPRFVVSGEISSIYKKNGKVRKVHNLIILPGLDEAEALSTRLEAIGNLHSDGRPILGLDSRNLLEIALSVCPEVIFIPAHIWTPHFSVFGAYSGFDHFEECFEDLTGNIFALETGLSSDPPMNWRLSALDKFTLVSNSDAHSPSNLAREANLFDTGLSYPHIFKALKNRDTREFMGTLEFFPEEGKYHYDGHRNCKVSYKPEETRVKEGICPVCGGKITLGVLHRVEDLADRSEGFVPPSAKHFESLVPLSEVIAASTGLTTASLKVKVKFNELIQSLGSELFILREARINDIELKAGHLVAEGINRLRSRKVDVKPGYDGEYGKVKILDQDEIDRLSGQLDFFNSKKKTSPKTKEKNIQKIAVKERPGELTLPVEKMKEQKSREVRDFSQELNQEQMEAVTSSSPVIAVIAGPGTGKTRTLVSRVAYLIQKCGVHPDRITAVTFTNKAANEMRSRLINYFSDEEISNSLHIGTFHSICLQILSRQNDGDPPTVIDEIDALSILNDILKDLHLKESPRNIQKSLSLLKSGALVLDENSGGLSEVNNLYSTRLDKLGVLDYDDILLSTLKLFENLDRSDLKSKMTRDSFSYLLVDEFQDINPVQYRLIKEWGKNNSGIFVIGDPDQSIYAFRGSDANCFNRLRDDFTELKEFKLTINYRSTPEILDSAQPVISKNKLKNDVVFLKPRRESGAKVRYLEAGTEFSEALFVTKEINRLVGGIDMLDAHKSTAPKPKNSASGTVRGFSDIAVLYRTNHQAEIFEQCFLKEGIPYVVIGRDNYLSDPEVRKITAFFRFLLNPYDIISLRFYLNTLEVFQTPLLPEILEEYRISDHNIDSLSRIFAFYLPAASASGFQKILDLFKKYQSIFNQEKFSKLIESWINDNNLHNCFSLEKLVNMAVFHESLPDFLHNLLLGRESDLVRKGGLSYSPDAVSLLTLHGSKGLEYPIVFISGIRDGLIPLKNTGGECNMDEERRLFYVGMTRAQDELILLVSSPASPFITDIPQDILLKSKTFIPAKKPEFEQLSFFNQVNKSPS